MRSKLAASVLVSTLLLSSLSYAKDKEENQVVSHMGVQFDVGVPDGAGLSVLVRPCKWAHINVGGTWNGFAPGANTGITLDPMNFPVALTLTGELGFSAKGKLIGLDNSPEISYTYANIMPGLEFGKRDSWRIFLRGGVSFISGTLYNLSEWSHNEDKTLTFSKPNFTAAFAPTGKIGFLVAF